MLGEPLIPVALRLPSPVAVANSVAVPLLAETYTLTEFVFLTVHWILAVQVSFPVSIAQGFSVTTLIMPEIRGNPTVTLAVASTDPAELVAFSV